MFNCLGKGKGKEKEYEEKEDWKDFTCDICGKEVATRGGLAKHKHIHSRPFPPHSFICDYPECGRTFNTQQHLNQHKRAHVRRDAGSSRKSGVLVRDFDLNQPPNY